MNDREPKEPKEPKSIEQLVEAETNELIATFAALRERFNVSSPDQLPEDEDVVQDALEDQGEWVTTVYRLAEAMGTKEAEEEANFLQTAFFITAGFTDRRYLTEVLDWLSQDEERALLAGFDGLASRIRKTIQQITDILDQGREDSPS